MRIKTFWTVWFIFSIFVYGSMLKKIGKINNFKIDSNAQIVSNGNILINPHYKKVGRNGGIVDHILTGINFYDIKDIEHPKVIHIMPVKDYPLKIDISKDKKHLFVLQDTLKIYNIENIKNPKLVASYYIDNSGEVSFCVSKKRNYLYITKPLSKTPIHRYSNRALYVYDIAKIEDIRLVSKKNIDGIGSIWISSNEKKLFYTLSRYDSTIMPHKQIGLADMSDIKHIKVVDESWRYFVGRGSHASVRSAFFSQDDKYLYIASGTYGVMVYDVFHNSLDFVQRTAGKKVLKFLNCTGAIYDIEHDEAYERLFAVGYEENEKKFKKLSCIKGFKKVYYIEGEKSVILEKRKILLVQNYDYFRDHHVDIYRW